MQDRAPEPVEEWQQLALMPPRAAEITLKVGCMAFDDHCQFQLSVEDPSTGELIALSSRPHMPWRAVYDELELWVDRLRQAVAEADQPF